MMRPKLKNCPRADELHALASGEAVSEGVRRHAAGCDTCSLIVENLLRDASLVQQIRIAAKTALDEKTQRDVLNACREAFEDDEE